MSNNEIIMDEEDQPTSEERVELATEQEQVRQMIQNTVGELNTYLAHACQIGMHVEMNEEYRETIIGIEVPQKIVTLVRATAQVGFRRPKK